jgi:hypothetical protein
LETSINIVEKISVFLNKVDPSIKSKVISRVQICQLPVPKKSRVETPTIYDF